MTPTNQHDYAIAVLTDAAIDLKGVGGLFQRLPMSKTRPYGREAQYEDKFTPAMYQM
jgi:hypothetical protein